MRDTPDTIPIIQTRAMKRLEIAVEYTAAEAGLCIVKGPVGIGKSFSLRHLTKTFRERGFEVWLVTARPETGGAMRAFVNDILAATHGRTDEAVQALDCMLLERPTGAGWRPPILIVDESQGLKGNILEMLRGVYDKGDAWRLGNPYSPAFGLMLVGNHTFLTKSGRSEAAGYGPLKDRVSLYLELDEADEDECRTLARALCPTSDDAADELARFGAGLGSLRSLEKVWQRAQRLADGGPITADLIRKAIYMVTGRL